MTFIFKLLAMLALSLSAFGHPTGKETVHTSHGSHGTVPKHISARWDGDIDRISYGDGWCVSFSKVPVHSRILWRLAANAATDFENSGLWYGRGVGGKWAVEIKRVVVNNGWSDEGVIRSAWNALKGGTFVRSGEIFYVGEHSVASIGQGWGDGEEATRIEVWITAITNWGPEYYQVLKRDEPAPSNTRLDGNSTYGNPPIKIDEKYLEKNVWKGPDPAYFKLNSSSVQAKPDPKSDSQLFKRAKYWDACSADDDNNQYYNRPVDDSVSDCMWLDRNNQYWSQEKASFPNLWSTFPCSKNRYLCCNQHCTRDGSSCCPQGQTC